MKTTTKVAKTASTLRTTIPNHLVKLLNIKKGDKLIWDTNIEQNDVKITVSLQKTEKK